MRMLRVVIADDEERICRLIEALVDWPAMGLEVAAVVHNGIEAYEAVEREKPDILITDIRMPGFSGLDLIEKVKQLQPDLELIIISGYAHFEYAQQAIRLGVGYYLLKPINKSELNSTLAKLKERIARRLESEQDKEALLRKAEQDDRQLRQKLIGDLMDKTEESFSREILRERYHFEPDCDLLQVFILKMDCSLERVSRDSAGIMMEKAREALERNLQDKCREFVLAVRGDSCIGVMGYEKKEQESIRKGLKNCLNTMEIQKNLFQTVAFSGAAGAAVTRPEELRRSFDEAELLIQERLVKGTGRLFERLGPPSALAEKNLLEPYLREIDSAIAMLNTEQAEGAADALLGEVRKIRGARGSEVLELVLAAADVFAARLQVRDRNVRLLEFRKLCDMCSDMDSVFACLKAFQQQYIHELKEQQENETVRPVRRAKQYIQKHYSEQITLEEVSDAVGLSAAYFSTLFKKTEGEGFARYLIHVRIEQAKILLRESNLPVTEVCRRVGYNDTKHFAHAFEKETGLKPSTYRKLYG